MPAIDEKVRLTISKFLTYFLTENHLNLKSCQNFLICALDTADVFEQIYSASCHPVTENIYILGDRVMGC